MFWQTANVTPAMPGKYLVADNRELKVAQFCYRQDRPWWSCDFTYWLDTPDIPEEKGVPWAVVFAGIIANEQPIKDDADECCRYGIPF